MTPIIWYIHGANSTPKSFAYLKACLPEHDHLDLAYGVRNPVASTVKRLVEMAEKETRPIYIVGHSLGGVIGLAVSQRCGNVKRVATMSSPFGGSKVASLLRWLVSSQLLDDIHPHSPLMQQVRRDAIRTPVMSIVSTGGHTALMPQANDGVVTVESQTSLTGPSYFMIPVNHFEVLLSSETMSLMTGFLFDM